MRPPSQHNPCRIAPQKRGYHAGVVDHKERCFVNVNSWFRLIKFLPWVALTSCQVLGGFDRPVGGAGGSNSGQGAASGAGGEPPHRCDPLMNFKIDDPRDAAMSLIKADQDRCFWMDQTEVSVKQYREWLERSPAYDDWDARCTWKPVGASDPIVDPGDDCLASIEPTEELPFNDLKPARCIDWCDAEAFCRENAGEGRGTLCHRLNDGGAAEPAWGSQDWQTGCSPDAFAYPWGNDASAVSCNTSPCESPICGAKPVDQPAACTSPEGVINLLGNVREWIFSCAAIDNTLPNTHCSTQGGSYEYDLQGCAGNPRSEPKSTRRADIGFRCCAELTLEEKALLNQ